MSASDTELLIVYNADAGVFAMLADAVHKVVSPATYPCSLCAITYGPVAMRGAWRSFLESLPNAVRFYHRDDFAVAFPGVAVELPAILIADADGAPATLVSARELERVEGVQALIDLVWAKLDALA